MYEISNQQRDVLIRAVELLAGLEVKGLRQKETVRLARIAARKLAAKQPVPFERNKNK